MNSSAARIHPEQLAEIYPVSRETIRRLEVLVDLLVAWQAKTNLVAPETLLDVWIRHIADSLQCIAIADTWPADRRQYWVDLGSGGGFPGLVVAAVLADRANGSVALVESNQKKAAFLRQANRKMGAGAEILAERVESVAKRISKAQIVTARAFAPLPKLLNYAAPALLSGATGLFHKGRDFRREIEDCDGLWSFDLIDHPSRIASDSVILEIRDLQRLSDI